jgi:hypothetical protein
MYPVPIVVAAGYKPVASDTPMITAILWGRNIFILPPLPATVTNAVEVKCR